MNRIDPFKAVSRCNRALGRDALIVRKQLESGECAAFECDQGVSIIRCDGGDLVIVAYEGQDGQGAFDYWCEVARIKGFAFVRFHSQRKGAARYIKDKAAAVETVYVKEL